MKHTHLTKKELVSALAGFSDDAQIIFNVDEMNRVLHLDRICVLNDDFVPDLCPDKSYPKIIIHLN